ncbi:protein kinase [Cystobacter fuscus]|uniref:protein kinase domain-containing protein n=1 Tax=Cystobacter fuscus TaxID=43 RepID=UPI0037BE6B30
MKKFTLLRDALVGLYSTASAARRVADDAELPHEHIRFEQPAIDFWHEILREADKHDKLNVLAKIASNEYPTDTRLKQVMASLVPLKGGPLEALYEERDNLAAKGLSTADIDLRIIELKRKLRRGPELHPDECLSDRYLLVEVIGDGGFGTVWKAYDRKWSRMVAIKVLHGKFTRDQSIIQRFKRGARAMARLKHPNVVKIEGDYAEYEGFHYFVMEFVEGENLESAVLSGKLDTASVVPLIQQIGMALQHAHSNGVIHRDVTPANILLRIDGTPLLTDFDLAILAGSTAGTDGGVGTLPYAALETWLDASSADERADLFSLGMITLFSLTRRRFNPRDVLRPHYLRSLIRDLQCSDAVKVAVARAVEEEPAQRHSSVAEFCESLLAQPSQELLEAYIGVQFRASDGGIPVWVRSYSRSEKPRSKVQRNASGQRLQPQRYKIPETTKKKVLEALEKFDRENREEKRWRNFTSHPRHKYGISYEGRLYPVKEILKQATGLDNKKFTGGASANARVAELGFKVVRLRSDDSVDSDAVAGRLFRDGDNHEEFDAISDKQREALLSWIRQTYVVSKGICNSTSVRLKRDFETTVDFSVSNGAFKGAMLVVGFDPVDDLQRNWRFRIRPIKNSKKSAA